MKRCPITYEKIDECAEYSQNGLRLLSKRLRNLKPFPYDVEEQLRLAAIMAGKISIQGVQPKLSARLAVQNQEFVPVETSGRYILKPQNMLFPNLPENEDVTMKLAAIAGCEVPVHGLIRCRDGRFTYFIKRFDRRGRAEKVSLEDFAQLAGRPREAHQPPVVP